MKTKRAKVLGGIAVVCVCFTSAIAGTTTAKVIIASETHGAATDAQNVVVWLEPLDGKVKVQIPAEHPRLVQHNKHFQPHLLVIPVGSQVDFPNHDPFFHNVFSLFEGKRFDLGLYEAGSTREVRFERPGISYIFCNIHPEMSAVIVALDTPFYGISNRQGEISIPDVPAGHYRMEVWYEGAMLETLKSMRREITIPDGPYNLGALHLPFAKIQAAHKNKYGRDYPPPDPQSPGYEH